MAPKKIILITGANQGIGFESAATIAAASANYHVIIGSRNPERGAKALEELQAKSPVGTLSLLVLDITSDESIKAASEKIAADFGVLDVLINNAGMIVTNPKDRRSELVETFNTNAASPLVLTEALIPLLKKSNDARIINVSTSLSSLSERTDPTSEYYMVRSEAYRISKAALNMATAHIMFDNRSWGAKVWAYCPGYVVTNLTGEEDRQTRLDQGADDPKTSAQGLLEIVEGKRDGEVGTFIGRNGLQIEW
ncbi:Short-chain dehydrogenase/reductase tropE [Colletotrichum sp. SAR 10_70]|nr:Short-chain dehydrogenase/reductase tropE [Colletotrichum sp. SAR 10_71]KAI8194465.1 Short-chain dehydrogenase/reductase tropE [Colletotrichum sp. SAR 10_70]KAI8213565.1 Short-chain dehydrogenase/reductase tropE [Colletotrichum sp. SAR 10_76]KAJ5003358.1 Short-chain dehydrogenase/reductase tropE [Colletotrichum sp. SAR 10_66]